MQANINHCMIELIEGDITQLEVDAIVNAANSRLAGGGGVDGAIHRRGGPAIMAETRKRYPDGCPTGSAVISTAGDLQARYVIHAVGPVWNGGGRGEPGLLAAAYRRCLELAVEHDCQSLAFPSLSTGAYAYPIELAAEVALSTVVEFLRDQGAPQRIVFALFGETAYRTFAATLSQRIGDAAS